MTALADLEKKHEHLQRTNPLFRAVEDFQTVQRRYAKWGANDTEPRAEFTCKVIAYMLGEDVVFVDRDWRLYTDMTGWKRVARALTAACQKVLKVADSVSCKQRREVREWFGWDA